MVYTVTWPLAVVVISQFPLYMFIILLLIGFFNLIYIFKIPLEILENQLTVMYYCPLHVKDFEFFWFNDFTYN